MAFVDLIIFILLFVDLVEYSQVRSLHRPQIKLVIGLGIFTKSTNIINRNFGCVSNLLLMEFRTNF